MRCIKCGANNPEMARFCAECGTGLQEGLADRKKADQKKPGSGEPISKYDKLFFLLSIAGGAILFFVGLVLSAEIAVSDPLFSVVLSILSFLVLGYALVMAVLFMVKFWPLLKDSKSSSAEGGLSAETAGQKETRAASGALKWIRLGGAVFAAVIMLAIVVTALLPRAQFNFRGASIPKEVVLGDRVIVTADSENFGRAAGNLELTIFVDHEEVQHEKILLEPGKVKNVEIDLAGDYQPGTYEYSFGIGPGKTISMDHGGRFRILTPPDFKIQKLSLVPNQFDFNEIKETKIRVEIDNIGEAPGTYHLDFEKDGVIKETMEVSIPGKGKRTVDLPIKVEGPGSYTIAVNEASEVLEVYNLERPRNNNIMLNKISGGYGHLKIVNNFDTDVVFVYARTSEPLESVLAVYVHANSTATVRGIRDGNYIGYYSSGLDWDSHSRRFTRNMDHGRYEDEFDYRTIHGETQYKYRTWTLEFGVLGTGGGAVTYSVSPERFPQLAE